MVSSFWTFPARVHLLIKWSTELFWNSSMNGSLSIILYPNAGADNSILHAYTFIASYCPLHVWLETASVATDRYSNLFAYPTAKRTGFGSSYYKNSENIIDKCELKLSC